MNFAEHPPSSEWAALKYRGHKIAEVWFKPEGEPFALTFRIPRESFQLPNLHPLLTLENLLGAVAIAKEEVESWCHGDATHSGEDGSNPELAQPFAPPPPEVAHLTINVRLRQPAAVEAGPPGGEPAISEVMWQELEARWNAILGLEASMDTLRISMEGLRAEMESSSSQTLTADEKVHALNADVAQWNKAKSRVVYALPKLRDFIHRSTWAKGLPERKKLEEFFKDAVPSAVTPAQLEDVHRMLENLLKDRQLLSSQGVTVYQDGKRLAADLQGALRTLQSNAATNARNKREAARKKGKFF